MKRLKSFFESLNFTNVTTYINSGNVVFESNKKPQQNKVENALEKEFGFAIRTLIKTEKEMQKITAAIPSDWQNDTTQKTDVAYLFKEADYKKIIGELPIEKDFIDIRYTPGALFWNIKRKNYNKSRLNKLISHKTYKFMTVRNINTARYLANSKNKI